MPDETSHTESVVITNGTREILAGQTTETVTLTSTGQVFAKTTRFLETKDKRTITDTRQQLVIASCGACGQGPFSTAAIVPCTKCQVIVCRACSQSFQNVTYCPACYRKTRKKWWTQWLTSIE